MSESSGEKTEEPTQKKIDDSRKQGQVWKSRDLSGVAVFLAGMGAVKITWDAASAQFRDLFMFTFEHTAHPEELERATFHAMEMGLWTVLAVSVPILAAAMAVGALTEFIMVGSLFAPEAVMPKLEKLDPIQGLKNMVSKKQLVEMLKSILKITITGYVAYRVTRDAMPLVVGTIRGDVPNTMGVMGELVFRVCVRVGIVFVIFAVFDLWFQKYTYTKELMMTKDEVKREYKESEGDPHHKAKRREMHMEILESAQMESVKNADVVVTNPDHVAVALRYDQEKDGAPRVLAKALDDKAQALKALARDHQVPLMRNVPLARALYRVDVGTEIPEGLYDAVAEVLNFVYTAKNAEVTASAGPQTGAIAER